MQGDQQELTKDDQVYWMKQALQQAKRAYEIDQVPVGCIFIRYNGQSYVKVQSSHNLTNKYKNASRHCEINCLYQMQKQLNKQEISNCILFVTVEPCIMCTFSLNLMGIKIVYFGQYNDKFGGCGSLRKDNKFEAIGGIMEKESLQIIKAFYERGNQRLPEEQRNRNRKKIKPNDQ